jgi:hypothetical protein
MSNRGGKVFHTNTSALIRSRSGLERDRDTLRIERFCESWYAAVRAVIAKRINQVAKRIST